MIFNKINLADKMGVEGKAVTSQSGRATSLTTAIPDTVKLTQDPVVLMNYNRGYVYAANTKIAQAVASLPFRMYAYVEKGQDLLTAHKAITGLKRKAIDINLGLTVGVEKELVEIYEHPFIDLINHPSDGWTRSDFFKVISAYLGLIGNSYVEVTRANKCITGLKPLQSEYMQIRYDENGLITNYIYQPTDTQQRKEYTPEDILHIRNRSAGSIISGMGDLEAALASVNLTTSTQAYISALLTNKAMPGGLFSVKGFTGDATKADKFTSKLLERFGRKNRGKPLVSFGDVTYTDMASTMVDARADYFTTQAKQEIAACFSVPLTLLDESNSNRATALTAQRSMQQYAVYPRTATILDQLNTEVVRKCYDDQLQFSYEPAEALDVDPKEQADVLKAYVEAGLYSVNEARAVLGMPALDNPTFDIPVAKNAGVTITTTPTPVQEGTL